MFSLLSSAASCAGFFLPYWIKGQLKRHPSTVATFFGTFRRCAFPQISADQTEIVIINECGRYSSFLDIPSVYWQLTTLIVGMGFALTLLSAVVSFLACWVARMWTGNFIRTLGMIHLSAGTAEKSHWSHPRCKTSDSVERPKTDQKYSGNGVVNFMILYTWEVWTNTAQCPLK